MYRVRKAIEIAGAHQLCLSYDSPCQNLHGHNWKFIIELSSPELDDNGMVFDFKELKSLMNEVIHNSLDHKNLNDVLDYNPTAENIAEGTLNAINKRLTAPYIKCTRVEIFESSNNCAIYEKGFYDLTCERTSNDCQ